MRGVLLFALLPCPLIFAFTDTRSAALRSAADDIIASCAYSSLGEGAAIGNSWGQDTGPAGGFLPLPGLKGDGVFARSVEVIK